MTDRPSPSDWELLGVTPGTPFDEVRHSYERLCSLWQAGRLQTYGLVEDRDRVAMIAAIEAAWSRVLGAPHWAQPDGTTEVSADTTPVEGPPCPDMAVDPGGFLRHHRLRRGLTLAQVAAITKIQSSTLEKLERLDLASLPARVFVRGFVIQYARALGLAEAEELAAQVLARMPAASQ